ncbi:MAG: hypothetical protein QNJ47_07140 [Nostocaceae cyanobacterium]|nr:hypothetical protein [Nostocaceae cyanobacterium]
MIYYPLILLLLLLGPALAAIPVYFSITLWQHWSLIGICILFGISPLLLAFTGLQLAKFFGCESATITFTCPQQPWLGNVLSFMVFAHWLAFLTIPSAAVGTVGLLITLVHKTNAV